MSKATRKKVNRRPGGTRSQSRSRRDLRVVLVLALVVVAGVVLVVASVTGDGSQADVPQGTEVVGRLSSAHVDGEVAYDRDPPVGGDHAPMWQNCGVYREPVRNELAVHSLQHGAVWIAYRPDLGADAVEQLEERARGETHVLVSPYEGLNDEVVLSAWGRQLRLQSAADDRIDQFIDAFQEGPQTPEPGAPCSGGVGQPR